MLSQINTVYCGVQSREKETPDFVEEKSDDSWCACSVSASNYTIRMRDAATRPKDVYLLVLKIKTPALETGDWFRGQEIKG